MFTITEIRFQMAFNSTLNKIVIFPIHCLEKSEVFCEDVCGKNPGVTCGGDKTNRQGIICGCQDDDKMFDKPSRTCKGKWENTLIIIK